MHQQNILVSYTKKYSSCTVSVHFEDVCIACRRDLYLVQNKHNINNSKPKQRTLPKQIIKLCFIWPTWNTFFCLEINLGFFLCRFFHQKFTLICAGEKLSSMGIPFSPHISIPTHYWEKKVVHFTLACKFTGYLFYVPHVRYCWSYLYADLPSWSSNGVFSSFYTFC